MTITNVYVDVDGVLNQVYANPGAGGWDKHCYRREEINGYRITWHTDAIYRLKQALERPDANIRPVWLTTWRHDAPRLISPALNIGADWDVLAGHGASYFWKRDAILQDLPDRFLWLDDDAPYGPNDFHHTPHLRVTPDQRVGLTKTHLDEIEAFLR